METPGTCDQMLEDVVHRADYQLNGADTKQRLTVRCPGKKALPYSGGMYTDPLGADGTRDRNLGPEAKRRRNPRRIQGMTA